MQACLSEVDRRRTPHGLPLVDGRPSLAACSIAAALLVVMPAAAAEWTVCPAGCAYRGPLEAWNAARAAIGPGHADDVTITVQDGTYEVGDQFYTSTPDTRAIHVVGNVGSPGRVIFDFTRAAGHNGDGFAAESGGVIGRQGNPGVDGVTLNGVGARLNRTTWADQSFGAGAHALGSGSNIYFGPHVVVQNFYYGALADQGGRFVGDGATYRNAGDANLLARFGGVIQCRSCALATAAHVFTDAHGTRLTLGRNALAEASASLDVDGSKASDGEVACFSAHTNGSVWAHDVTATRCPTRGVEAQQNGFVEANDAHVGASGVGAYADTGGRLNVDRLQLDHNRSDGLLLNGGSATGTGLDAHDNGGFGIRVVNGGRGEFYGTLSRLTGNKAGTASVQPSAGCAKPADTCNPAGTLIAD